MSEKSIIDGIEVMHAGDCGTIREKENGLYELDIPVLCVLLDGFPIDCQWKRIDSTGNPLYEITLPRVVKLSKLVELISSNRYTCGSISIRFCTDHYNSRDPFSNYRIEKTYYGTASVAHTTHQYATLNYSSRGISYQMFDEKLFKYFQDELVSQMRVDVKVDYPVKGCHEAFWTIIIAGNHPVDKEDYNVQKEL